MLRFSVSAKVLSAEELSTAALIGLGSNLGNPLGQLRRAHLKLMRLGEVLVRSSLYRSAPIGGPLGQPDYLNAVIALAPLPEFSAPEALLRQLLAIECAQGRKRHQRWEARTLDLDLLALGDTVRQSSSLILPHPRMMLRGFVLAPLLEIAPDWRHPLSHETVAQALQTFKHHEVVKTDLSWS